MTTSGGNLPESYLTVARNGEGKFTEKMSRFISFAFPASTTEEARELVKKIANDYHDARHVCWAFTIGADRSQWLANDNGEPSGTAGKPILGQINSAGLTNVVVIVVRYFGGIKLGTPGLIAAYREAARLAIADAGKKEVTVTKPLSFSYPYVVMNQVRKIVKETGVKITGQQMDNRCFMTLDVPVNILKEVNSRIENIPGLTIINQ